VAGARHIPALAAPLNWNSHGVLHTLARHGVPTIGLAARPREEVTYSRYARQKVWYDRADPDGMWRALVELGRRTDTPIVVFWGDDDSVVQASERRDELPETLRFVLPPREVVRRLVVKTDLYPWASANGFRVGRTIVLDSEAAWARAVETGPLPGIVKPAFRTAGWEAAGMQKVFRVDARDELRALHTTLPALADGYVLQEWIPGPETNLFFHLAYHDREGRPLAGFTGRKIRQWPPDTGSFCAAEPWEDGEIDAEARRLLEAAGLCGLGAVELKRDERDGSLWVIEPTCGRANGQSEMATANGVDIIHLAYCDAAGIEPPEVGRRSSQPVRFFTLGPDVRAAAELRRQGRITWREFLRSYRGPRIVVPVDARDPVPLLLLLLGFVRSAFVTAVRGPRLRP
jgi:D-aspartate ligase